MKQESFILENINSEELIKKFKRNFFPDFSFINDNGTTIVYIIEKFSFRVNSNLSATIIFDFLNKNKCEISLISSGGATGLLQISWG